LNQAEQHNHLARHRARLEGHQQIQQCDQQPVKRERQPQALDRLLQRGLQPVVVQRDLQLDIADEVEDCDGTECRAANQHAEAVAFFSHGRTIASAPRVAHL